MTTPRWRTLAEGNLYSRLWDGEDEAVVFNAASGDLHLLNLAAYQVLVHLGETSATAEELARTLSMEPGAVTALLRSFDALGLVRPGLP